jgi:hypothetical protein
LLPVSNIDYLGHKVHRILFRPTDNCGRYFTPSHLTVLVKIALFMGWQLFALNHNFENQSDCVQPIFGISDRSDVSAEQLLFAVSEEIGEGSVGCKKFTLKRYDDLSDWRALKLAADCFFPFCQALWA